MIYSILRDQDRSFWCQYGWKHKTEDFFLWNEVVEVIEATEAVEVIDATDILRPGKSLSTPASSRLLNLDLFWCFKNHFFSGIMKSHFSIFAHFLMEPRLFFKKIGSNNQNAHISRFQNYPQIYSNLYISFSQSQIKKNTLPLDTLYAVVRHQ